MKIIHTSKKFLKNIGLCYDTADSTSGKSATGYSGCKHRLPATSYREQAKIKLEVSMDANQKLTLPALRDTIVRGVEILDIANLTPKC